MSVKDTRVSWSATPMDRNEMMKYRANSAMNEMMDALPASFVSFARVEITTAPSIPMKTHTVVKIQAFVCSKTFCSWLLLP